MVIVMRDGEEERRKGGEEERRRGGGEEKKWFLATPVLKNKFKHFCLILSSL